MSVGIDPAHPRVELVFYAVGGGRDVSRDDVARLIVELSLERDWVIGPPVFIDEVEAGDEYDAPREILGGALDIYSLYPPHDVPAEIDRKHLEEVETVISALQDLTRATGSRFEIAFNGESIGAVERGELCDELESVLLDPWRASHTTGPG